MGDRCRDYGGNVNNVRMSSSRGSRKRPDAGKGCKLMSLIDNLHGFWRRYHFSGFDALLKHNEELLVAASAIGRSMIIVDAMFVCRRDSKSFLTIASESTAYVLGVATTKVNLYN